MRKHLSEIAVAVIAVISISIIIWGFNKGFNLSDGGFYVLRYQSIQPSTPSGRFLYDHFLVKALVPQSVRSVKDLRFIGFWINLLSTGFFAYAISVLHSKLHKTRISFKLLVLMMLSGFILSYTGLPSELSYNRLNQFFLINTTSLVLLAMVTSGKQSRILALISGVACCFIYLSKSSSGLLMSIFCSIILFVNDSKDIRRIFMFWLPHLVSLLAAISIVKFDPILMVKDIVNNPADHTVAFLIRKTSELIPIIIGTLLLSALISYALRVYYKYKEKQHLSIFGLVVGLLSLTVFLSVHVIGHLSGQNVDSSFFLLIIGMMFFTLMLDNGFPFRAQSRESDFLKRNKLLFEFAVLLVLVPYIGAFGSNVPFNWISKYYFLTFIGLIGLVLPRVKNDIIRLWAPGFFIYLIAIGLYHYVQYPYAYEPRHKPLYKQTEYYKGILHAPDRVEYYKKTEEVLTRNGFKPEQGMIIPYIAPGIAYLMGTYHVGGMLWRSETQKAYFALLKKTKLQYKPVIISVFSPPEAEFQALLYDATGLDFKKDYWLADEYECFDKNGTTSVYFPYTKEISSRIEKLK